MAQLKCIATDNENVAIGVPCLLGLYHFIYIFRSIVDGSFICIDLLSTNITMTSWHDPWASQNALVHSGPEYAAEVHLFSRILYGGRPIGELLGLCTGLIAL